MWFWRVHVALAGPATEVTELCGPPPVAARLRSVVLPLLAAGLHDAPYDYPCGGRKVGSGAHILVGSASSV